MPDFRGDALAELYEEGDAFLRRARSAAQVSGDVGSDGTASVSVALDAQGQVTGVTVMAGWQRRVGAENLSEAVVEAVRDAAMRRLDAWGQAFGEDDSATRIPAATDGSFTENGSGAEHLTFDRDEFQRRLQQVTTGQMSEEDRRVALIGLLELAEAIERGIDEVSDKLQTTLAATHTGQRPDRHVSVTLTGGGEVTAVRLDRAWLREAHEINIGRQLTAAFRAAYEKVAAHGVSQLIADSPLGEVQRATQDPLGLAHRLRLID